VSRLAAEILSVRCQQSEVTDVMRWPSFAHRPNRPRAAAFGRAHRRRVAQLFHVEQLRATTEILVAPE
jgi:hypothetical protein